MILSRNFLNVDQKVFVAGHHDGKDGDSAYYSTCTTSKVTDATLTYMYNAEEADTRI